MSEPPEIREISWDYPDMHFLDHTIGTRYCRSLNGTARHSVWLHWRYTREYKHTWDQRLVHRALCGLGRHEMRQWWRPKTSQTGMSCEWCGKKGEIV